MQTQISNQNNLYKMSPTEFLENLRNDQIFPLTKITAYNPLWKMEAWCRRVPGCHYLYAEKNTNVVRSDFELQTDLPLLSYWVDGICVFTHTENMRMFKEGSN